MAILQTHKRKNLEDGGHLALGHPNQARVMAILHTHRGETLRMVELESGHLNQGRVMAILHTHTQRRNLENGGHLPPEHPNQARVMAILQKHTYDIKNGTQLE